MKARRWLLGGILVPGLWVLPQLVSTAERGLALASVPSPALRVPVPLAFLGDGEAATTTTFANMTAEQVQVDSFQSVKKSPGICSVVKEGDTSSCSVSQNQAGNCSVMVDLCSAIQGTGNNFCSSDNGGGNQKCSVLGSSPEKKALCSSFPSKGMADSNQCSAKNGDKANCSAYSGEKGGCSAINNTGSGSDAKCSAFSKGSTCSVTENTGNGCSVMKRLDDPLKGECSAIHAEGKCSTIKPNGDVIPPQGNWCSGKTTKGTDGPQEGTVEFTPE